MSFTNYKLLSIILTPGLGLKHAGLGRVGLDFFVNPIYKFNFGLKIQQKILDEKSNKVCL